MRAVKMKLTQYTLSTLLLLLDYLKINDEGDDVDRYGAVNKEIKRRIKRIDFKSK